MPSAFVKAEKVSTSEASDAVKQILIALEKRVRNLEKRKVKLDNYRNDVKNGKELNDDQRMAVGKYDQVEGNLEFAKELSKSMGVIIAECARYQKKQAKKEQLERQQREIKRLQEAFIFRHILSQFQNEDVRSDFLNGTNGAVQLTSEQLSQMDHYYKLLALNLPNEQENFVNHFRVLAENFIFLVESKNKEIAGTTYKVLKELLSSVRDSGYFDRTPEPVEVPPSEQPEEEPKIENAPLSDFSAPENLENISANNEPYPVPEPVPTNIVVPEELVPAPLMNGQNGPLHEVLAVEGSFNFLQESQIDLDAPHMDPAVVAVHQMPPPTANFAVSAYAEDVSKLNGEVQIDSPQRPSANAGSGVPSAAAISAVDFDPSHPIPTQTFTNQSFAVMQNIIMPHGVAVHHAVLPPHMAPITVVPGIPPSSPPATVLPLHVPIATVPVPVQDVQNESKETAEIPQVNGENTTEIDRNANFSADRNDGNGYTQFRGGYRGRGRGRGNYFRGRNNYHHNNRGGYQNHYYQDRNGYNNFRRGNRGGPRGNGINRGRGNYKSQSSQQQQAPPPQQTQQ